MIQVLAERLGFNIHVKLSTRWIEWVNDTWVGCIGDVINGDAHFAVSELYILEWTFSLVDFIFHYNFYMHYKTAKPNRLPPYLNLFKPFAPETWLGVGLTLPIVAIIYVFFQKIIEKKNDNFQSAMEIFMQQFSQALPDKKAKEKKTSTNILLVTWYAYTFLVHAAYDCNLRAYLMSADLEPVVNNAKDIYHQGRALFFYAGWSELEFYR